VPKVQAKMASEPRRLAHHYNRVRLSQLKRMLDDSMAIGQRLAHAVSRHPSKFLGDRVRRDPITGRPRKVRGRARFGKRVGRKSCEGAKDISLVTVFCPASSVP